DTPLNVYNHPADRFVAGFLGTPPMNFFDGRLEHAEGQLWFVGEGMRLGLGDAPREWLAGEEKRPIVAGIRPEGFDLGSADGETASAVAATVQVIEPLGSTMDVYLQTTAGHRLVCRIPAGQLTEGANVTASVSPQDIHLFEPNAPGDTSSPTHYGRNLRTLQAQLV
ncbi:MAG: TOBE domain-containing protein, partial [Pirellulales bacterium]|nr:TOBE domain-containing protein [Pirellulales bacterium]